jgi:hypothetical protein
MPTTLNVVPPQPPENVATHAAFERPGQRAQYQTRKTSELKQNAGNEEVE